MINRHGTLLIHSPVGKILLAAREGELTHLLFADRQRRPAPMGDDTLAAARILADAEKQLQEYFCGRRRAFDLPLSPSGTAFQLSVWSALLEIPFGETVSYGELARRVGRAKAARAVGAANGANPISIIIPCHRVIGRNRRLTGYGGGLPAKKTLLQ
ncbi:MAG: methylated-DNA--[protein]-cysteine S-methyltransferase, partial [Candidatus Eisenbacteria bacterium]|nr:methylated-DNA--[protein]-cysteine S-methyltransferase [Candidatus Eisenbacteria bacterium]